MIAPSRRVALRRRLLAWYRDAARDLPWRRDPTPYAVWLSEIMLQQTQVAVVLPHYTRFRARFPTIEALAAAGEEAVLAAWQGLGYYGRARRLHAAARRIVAEHGGSFPSDPQAALALPGIGRYTAGAILSIAYGEPLPVVDGNVARVLARLEEIDGTLEDAAARALLWRLASELVPAEAPGDWNQALMELGALVCTAAAPRCDACPVRLSCRARAAGRTAELPPPRRRRRPPRIAVAVAWIEQDGAVLVTRRGDQGVLAGFWELPAADLPGARAAAGDASMPATLALPTPRAARTALRPVLRTLGIDRFRIGAALARVTHTMFNRRAELTLFPVGADGGQLGRAGRGAGAAFVDLAAPAGRPLTTATRKLMAAVASRREAAPRAAGTG
ncbi:MAG: A/G-specific adenine glycosylase [Candidatus Eiseniibacteriota bacterium]|jgi:A/G-specific adenine glycosylase